MNFLQIVILIFCILESLNILVLYTRPSLTQGNGLGVFKPFHDLQSDKDAALFVKYLINWVANVKMIFVALLIVILIFGDKQVQFYAIVANTISTFMYFITLHPIIKAFDKEDKLVIKGYSKTLGIMIATFILMFLTAIIFYLI